MAIGTYDCMQCGRSVLTAPLNLAGTTKQPSQSVLHADAAPLYVHQPSLRPLSKKPFRRPSTGLSTKQAAVLPVCLSQAQSKIPWQQAASQAPSQQGLLLHLLCHAATPLCCIGFSRPPDRCHHRPPHRPCTMPMLSTPSGCCGQDCSTAAS
jgi:hypothetical protein